MNDEEHRKYMREYWRAHKDAYKQRAASDRTKRSRENTTWCKNDRFCVGQIYKIRADHKEMDAFVSSISRYYVTFATPQGDISGELMQVTNPRCQSCNIDGFDIIYSYECRAKDVP